MLSRSLHSPLQLLVCNGKGTKFIFGFASSCKLLQIVAIFSVIFFVFLDYFHSYAIYMTSRVARSRPQRCS